MLKLAIFSTMHSFILDTLFPVRCISCRKYGDWLCEKCLKNIKLISEHSCPRCEKVSTNSGTTCLDCRDNFSLDGLVSAASYHDDTVSEAVHFFKYRFVEDLATPLAELMARSYVDSNNPLPDMIVPVPFHPRRLRWRGFNQAELLARELSEKLAPGINIGVDNNLLLRKKYTRPQMKIKKYRDRIANMRNTFSSTDDVSLVNKHILLVDDIATTGTTLLECAKILKKLHARKVTALIIARQELKKDKLGFKLNTAKNRHTLAFFGEK